MHTTDTVTLQVGTARIEIPAVDVARQVLASSVASLLPTIHAVPLTPPPIGQYWPGQGGVYAGLMRNNSGPDYHLVVATATVGSIEEIEWGSRGEDESGARDEYDGLANTEALANSNHEHPAAEWAARIEIEGRSDFYLPARRELALCFANVPELFEKAWYWSSTQSSANTAWGQYFAAGHQTTLSKTTECRARAVRRVLDH